MLLNVLHWTFQSGLKGQNAIRFHCSFPLSARHKEPTTWPSAFRKPAAVSLSSRWFSRKLQFGPRFQHLPLLFAAYSHCVRSGRQPTLSLSSSLRRTVDSKAFLIASPLDSIEPEQLQVNFWDERVSSFHLSKKLTETAPKRNAKKKRAEWWLTGLPAALPHGPWGPLLSLLARCSCCAPSACSWRPDKWRAAAGRRPLPPAPWPPWRTWRRPAARRHRRHRRHCCRWAPRRKSCPVWGRSRRRPRRPRGWRSTRSWRCPGRWGPRPARTGRSGRPNRCPSWTVCWSGRRHRRRRRRINPDWNTSLRDTDRVSLRAFAGANLKL